MSNNNNNNTIVIRADDSTITPQPPHRLVEGRAEWTFNIRELSKDLILATLGGGFVAGVASCQGLVQSDPTAYWAINGFYATAATLAILKDHGVI
ncbi:hypothetical protein F4824DRAFT_504233 [Ustulina deusta]|nr:hypothetical protein F4824DRAFT_504233 [Ustulina deusta]